jgi:hypothetical protein
MPHFESYELSRRGLPLKHMTMVRVHVALMTYSSLLSSFIFISLSLPQFLGLAFSKIAKWLVSFYVKFDLNSFYYYFLFFCSFFKLIFFFNFTFKYWVGWGLIIVIVFYLFSMRYWILMTRDAGLYNLFQFYFYEIITISWPVSQVLQVN